MHRLAAHARSAPPPGVTVQAHAVFDAQRGVVLEYRIEGAIERLRIPDFRLAAPADGLWQHTCCEAFVATPGEAPYREFNFSPSRQWATYDFDAYRQHAPISPPPWSPALRIAQDPRQLTLSVTLPLRMLPDGGTGPLQLALSVVLEHADGALSYWALRHPAAQPDFHHRESFTCLLAPDTVT